MSMGGRHIIRTAEDRAALVEALKHDHPTTVAERFGLKRRSISKYIREAKKEETERLKARGYTPSQIDQELNRIFERDGVQIGVVAYGRE